MTTRNHTSRKSARGTLLLAAAAFLLAGSPPLRAQDEMPLKSGRSEAREQGATAPSTSAHDVSGGRIPAARGALRSPGQNLALTDFEILANSPGDPTVCYGSTYEVVVTFTNAGTVPIDVPYSVRLCLSEDPYSLGECQFQQYSNTLPLEPHHPGEARQAVFLVTMPAGAGTARHYLFAYLDSAVEIAEDDEGDNSGQLPIMVTSLPDLIPTELTSTTAFISIGDNIQNLFRFTCWNDGCARAVVNAFAGRVTFYLSADPYIDHLNDLPLLTQWVSAVDAKAGRPVTSLQAIVPATAPLGMVYLGVVVDRYGEIAEANEFNNTMSIPIEVRPAPAVAPDTTWVSFDDFQDGPGDWTARDLNVTDVFWHRADYDDGGTTRGVMWCGTNDGLLTPPGYGNGWVNNLTRSFTLGPSPSLSYRIQYDSEPGYDFTCVRVSTDDFQTSTLLRCLDGMSNGFVTFDEDLSAWANQTVQIRFRFASDGAWSDQDGLYPSDGACRLDWVDVSGTTSGSDVSTFETGDDGWVGSGLPSNGIVYRFERELVCDGGLPCDSLFVRYSSDGTTPVREPYGPCSGWVAYDPVTHVFPFRPTPGSPKTWTGIESPPIPVPTDGEKMVLRYDCFSNLPLANNLFHTFHVSCDNRPWVSSGVVLYGAQGWRRTIRDITSMITPGTTQVRVRIGCTEYYAAEGATHSGGPIFDNIAIGVVNSPTLAGVADGPSQARACDFDRDGVLDYTDLCPEEGAAPFDKDGDGCRDAVATSRNVEYWTAPEFPVHYVISDQGPAGLDFTEVQAEVQAAFNAWTGLAGSQASFQFDGLVPGTTASPGDGINLVTFRDAEYPFPNGVLAVGVATSYVTRTHVDGVYYRPGEIRDADMIFNQREVFKTPGSGPADGVDLRSVATHEAGHVLGLSHSAARTSTMFYVLPPGTDASSLSPEDVSALRSAYPDPVMAATRTELRGTVRDGYTNAGVPGVIVYAISEATNDTTGCTYTLADGTYQILGMEDPSVYVSIHALDGTSEIGFITGGNINQLVADMAVGAIVTEYFDAAESSSDDPAAKTAVTLNPGGVTTVDLVTNIDSTGPSVVLVSPTDGGTGVPIDAALQVAFSEAIDPGTVSGHLRVRNTVTSAQVAGNAAFFNDGRTLSFIPSDFLAFETTYELELGDGIKDRFGNNLLTGGTPALVSSFTTQALPPVAISSLSPTRGVAGTVLVISGHGFDPSAALNLVNVNATSLVPAQASPGEVVVVIPADTPAGALSLSVTNLARNETSNAVTFTVLPPEEVARGFTTQEGALPAAPHCVRVAGAGGYAYVATGAGVSAVNIDHASPAYLQQTDIPVTGGADVLDVTPDGKLVFAISTENQKVYRINVDPAAGPMGVLNESAFDGRPLGIAIDPAGRTAYIARDDGSFVMWDVRVGFPTFDHPIDAIATGDPNLGGKFAVHPAGDRLVALSGGGKLLVIDLGTRRVTGAVSVGTSPADVTVDPMGERAYVTDADGFVTVVSLTTMERLLNLRTGGSLRGVDVSPSGAFLFAVDHELNFLDVIDLRSESSSFGTVAARSPLPVDPADVELSNDGLYAFSVTESGNRLVVTSVGVGPVAHALSGYAGPVGGKVVITGTGFAEAVQTVVTFNGVVVTPERLSDQAITVSVPAGATSGAVVVEGRNPGAPTVSNAFFYEVLGPSSAGAAVPGEMADDQISADVADVAVSPTGESMVVLADEAGGFRAHVVDTDPASASLHGFIGSVTGTGLRDVVIPGDGGRAFLLLADGTVQVVDINRLSDGYLGTLATVDLAGAGEVMERLAVSPDGGLLLVAGRSEPAAAAAKQRGVSSHTGSGSVRIVDVNPRSASAYGLLGSVAIANAAINLDGSAGEMAFHPAGAVAYVPVLDSDPPVIRILDVDRASAGFGTFVADHVPALPAGQAPRALSFTPDGSRCIVLASPHGAAGDRTVVMLDTSNPLSPLDGVSQTIASAEMDVPENIHVSPRGDRCIAVVRGSGFHPFGIGRNPDALVPLGAFGDPADHAGETGGAYAADGNRFYAAFAASDRVRAYGFTDAQSIALKSGADQTGVVGAALPAGLEVEVASGNGFVPGVPVRFTVVAGGGGLAGGASEQVVSTDASGVARVEWTLGSLVGVQRVEASAGGLTGSPIEFTAMALEDPNTLPLRAVEVLPAPERTGVSTTTTILARFSRPVDRASVHDGTFSLMLDGIAVPAVLGFADDDRKVSLTPTERLEYQLRYQLVIGDGIRDAGGGSIENPFVSAFETEAPPPLDLLALSPPSGTTGIRVTLSGSGFSESPAGNTVLFDATVPAVVNTASHDALNVTIPADLAAGDHVLQVLVGTQNSAPFGFRVLQESSTPFEQVTAKLGTSSETRAVAIAPNGRYVYAVAPKANSVIVLDLKTYSFLPAIPAGENPYAIAIHPRGSVAYVANLLSNTVTVIDIKPDSPTFNRVMQTIRVGMNPTDMAVSGKGDRLLVANFGSGDLSIIDANGASESFHQVIGTAATGTGTRSVAITPDGGRIYVGTSQGYLVIDALDFGVIATTGTSTGTKSVAITPDGTLAIVLTVHGEVLVFDIAPGSPRENQVIATSGTSTGTKSVSISPDGGLAFLVTDEVIIVVSLNFGTSAAVVDQVVAPRTLQVVAIITAGENPAYVAFDPTGSGTWVVTNAGDNSISVFDATPPRPQATVLVTPETFSMRRKAKYMAAHIEFAVPYSVHDIDIGSVYLHAGAHPDSIRALATGWSIGDTDLDGVEDLSVKFDGTAFARLVAYDEQVFASVTGVVRGARFAGGSNVKIIMGLVTASSHVALADFRGSSEDGTNVLRWVTNFEADLAGFNLLRAESEDGPYERVNAELVPASGGSATARYAYPDARGVLNRKYFYRLEAVVAGAAEEMGPFEVLFRAPFTLAQNAPNPFNPTTRIRFTLPEEGDAALVIYDVAGRRVRTLFDERRPANHYVVQWDGRDERGQPVASGVYFCRLVAGRHQATRKMLLLK